ncbi:MAG: sulfatase-like hydrolase/transferase, partial [Candidatus Aminicenantes bacterium]|nr:sulfatase-like hydrolase/transferase [Candidatus Aminicenantes bacterium]
FITGDAFIYDLIAKEKRNHVFIVALDTKRWDKIGRSVKGIVLTPNLDRFQQDAVVFEQAFAQSPWTLPSFTAFFTGLYEFNNRIFRHRVLDARNPFLVENFSKQYLTASINGGTWLSGKIGNSRGFDSYELGSGARDIYAGKILFKKSMEFIEKTRTPALFLFMHTYAIHAPYIPPREFLHKLNKNPRFTAQNTYSKNKQFKKNVPAEIKKAMEELYEAEIMAFDSYFGEFIAYLKRNGLYDRSLIVFFSDHGEEFYDHLGWSHGHSLYNELIKVPLIIKFPGDKYQSIRVTEIVGIIDILPTLLDYLHIEQAREIDGISLMPLIKKAVMPPADRESENRQNDRKSRRFLVSSLTTCPFFDQVPKKVAILFDHYKLIYNFAVSEKDKAFFRDAGLPPEVPRFQVFDLINDPLETYNLYPGCKNLIKGYRKELNEILKKIRFILKRKKSAEIELSEEEVEKLKALGYL